MDMNTWVHFTKYNRYIFQQEYGIVFAWKSTFVTPSVLFFISSFLLEISLCWHDANYCRERLYHTVLFSLIRNWTRGWAKLCTSWTTSSETYSLNPRKFSITVIESEVEKTIELWKTKEQRFCAAINVSSMLWRTWFSDKYMVLRAFRWAKILLRFASGCKLFCFLSLVCVEKILK